MAKSYPLFSDPTRLQVANWKRAACIRAIHAARGVLLIGHLRSSDDKAIQTSLLIIHTELDKLEQMVRVNYNIEKLEILLDQRRKRLVENKRQEEKMRRLAIHYGSDSLLPNAGKDSN